MCCWQHLDSLRDTEAWSSWGGEEGWGNRWGHGWGRDNLSAVRTTGSELQQHLLYSRSYAAGEAGLHLVASNGIQGAGKSSHIIHFVHSECWQEHVCYLCHTPKVLEGTATFSMSCVCLSRTLWTSVFDNIMYSWCISFIPTCYTLYSHFVVLYLYLMLADSHMILGMEMDWFSFKRVNVWWWD